MNCLIVVNHFVGLPLKGLKQRRVLYSSQNIYGGAIFEKINIVDLRLGPKYVIGYSLRKIPNFHLIAWCKNFVERHSFCRVSGNLPETAERCR